jgi:hypothetical protein
MYEKEATYRIHLDENDQLWIVEIDFMAWADKRRNCLDDEVAIEDLVVIADVGTDCELVVGTVSTLLRHRLFCSSNVPVRLESKVLERTFRPFFTFSSPQKCSPSTFFATFSRPASFALPIMVMGDRRLQKRVCRIPVSWRERQMC